jgi:methyl-accepting chemotaxis protein PixJ
MPFHSGKPSQQNNPPKVVPPPRIAVSAQVQAETVSAPSETIAPPTVSKVPTQNQSKPWHTKAMLSAIAVGVLPVLVLGSLGFLVTTRQTAQAIAAQQQQQASHSAALTKQFLRERYQDLEALTDLLMVAESDKATKSFNFTGASKQSILEAAKQNYGVYESLAVMNLQGDPLVKTAGETWENQGGSAYFQTALKEKKAVMGNITAGLIHWAAPMQDPKTGQVVALLVARLPIANLFKQLPLNLTPEQQVYLLDQSGNLLLSTVEAPHPAVKIWHQKAQQQSEQIAVSPNLQWGLAVSKSPAQLKSEYAVGVADLPTIANQKLNWQIVQAVKPEVIVAAQQQKLFFLLLATIAGATLTATIARLSARKAANLVEGEVEILRQKEQEYQQQQQRQAERSKWSRQIVESMRQSLREEDILNTTVTELRHALNTNRVIVYKFHDDWNGTIVAESAASGWKKILGETVRDPFREGLIERYRNGRVRAMADIKAENLTKCHEDILDGFQIRASIVAPIVRNGELIGLLCAHHCAEPRHWTEEDIDLFGKLASQLGFVLEQATLIQKQAKSMERSRILNEIVDNMRRSNEESEILNITVSELRYALNTDRVIVYKFLDDWNGKIIAESVALGSPKILGEYVRDPFREGLIERYRNGRVRSMSDIYAEELTDCHRELLEGFQIKASIVAPILQNGHLIGLLCAHQCFAARQWEEEDIDLFAKLARQLGFALDQASAMRKQTISAERSRVLNEIVGAMRRSLKEEDILNTTVSELRYALNTDRVIVYRFDDDWNGTIIAEAASLTCEKILGKTVHDPFKEGLIERYRNGRVRSMNDIYAEEIAGCHQALLEGFQIRASIVAPIVTNGELIGLLCAHQCDAPREWETEDVDLFAKLAIQLGFALDQSAVLSKQIRSAEQSRLLGEIVGNMRRSMTRESVLNTTVSELRYALKTDRVIVYHFHDDWNGEIVAESVASGWRKILGEYVEDPFREGLIERYQNGRVRSINDILTENLTQCHQELLEGFQIRASIVAPVTQNGELVGLLCAHQCDNPRQWQPEEIDLFTQMAIQLGFALDQASMLEFTEQARQEARREADAQATEQQQARELLQQRARELLQEVTPVSRGDLTVQARVTQDEVGTIANSYNTIIQSLRQIVTQVQTTSSSLAITTSNNESAVSGLSQEAKHQMQSLKEALKNVEMMIDAIESISIRAKNAEHAVHRTSQTLAAGDAAMDRTVSGMSAIRETVAETAKKVKRLGEASQKISRVVSLINGFAAQTNMLALNAAIEASKAGEEGQGFGVVAEKVRSLAQQSTAATAEIEQLVEEIQSQTNDVVMAMETGTDQVVMGTHLVEESRQHLSQINEAGSQINQLVKEIAQVTISQTQTSQLVRQKMQQVATIADNTSQQAENVSESFKHLLKMADELQISVAQFKVK